MTLEESQEVIPLLEVMIGHIEEQQLLMAELYQELEERDEQLLALQEQNQQWQELAEKLNDENHSLKAQNERLLKLNAD